jgi:GNAT superfamily N-acetyltransferase
VAFRPGTGRRDAAMSAPHIIRGPLEAGLWRKAEEIFFLSATTQRFDSEEKRQAFLDRWTGYYREWEPQRIYLAVLGGGGVAGYLTGCRDSRLARRLYRDIPYYALFEDRFGEYPAHLHVNVHPQWRGVGVGSRLVNAFVEDCAAAHLDGVHVITAPGLPNVGFYGRCGFTHSVQRVWQERKLLFLGRSLRRT